MWTIAVLCIAGLLLADVLLHYVCARLALPVFEDPPLFGVRKHDPEPETPTSFATSSGGLKIALSVFRPATKSPRAMIVFCPELGSDRWSARWYCQGLLEAGYVVVSFDFANQGDSDHRPGHKPLHWPTQPEVDDVQAVMTWISEQEEFAHLPVGLFGLSRGGAVALVAGARMPQIRVIVADGAYSVQSMLYHFLFRWGSYYVPQWLVDGSPKWHALITIRLTEKMSEWRRGATYLNFDKAVPDLKKKDVLLISGQRDTYIVPAFTEEMHRKLGAPPDRLWIVPKAKHNMARTVDPAAYDDRIVGFFDQHLSAVTAPRECAVA